MAKPGGIDGPGVAGISAAMRAMITQTFGDTPTVHVSELAAVMIDQCLHGITEEPLWAKDIVRIGKGLLKEEDYVK